MQNPSRLRVFAESEELALSTYRLARSLPHDERYALGQQLRRAAVSIGSNIAEGCGRGGNRELMRFLSIALGWLGGDLGIRSAAVLIFVLVTGALLAQSARHSRMLEAREQQRNPRSRE